MEQFHSLDEIMSQEYEKQRTSLNQQNVELRPDQVQDLQMNPYLNVGPSPIRPAPTKLKIGIEDPVQQIID